MTQYNAIINILEEQIKTYKLLQELLHRERTCLVNIDPEKVEEISKEKDTVVMRLRLLEEERQRLIRVYADKNGIDSEINLEELGKITGNKLFPSLRSQLLALLQNIEEMNKFNSILIDRSMNFIRTNTSFFNSFVSENNARTTGVLLSRET
jgi:flagellar biosynthesis/type III secretory pathway chaperone